MHWTLWITLGALAIAVGWLAWSPSVAMWGQSSTDLAGCPGSDEVSCVDTVRLTWAQSSPTVERATCAYPYGSTWPGDDE